MKRDYTDYLLDIMEYTEKALRFTKGIGFDRFKNNEEKTLATIRALEVIRGSSTPHTNNHEKTLS